MVGGPTAEVLDAQTALHRDARLIVPLALVLVFLIVAILLRSLIAPIYVIATVILSYAFALGVSSLIFEKSDPARAAVHVPVPGRAGRRLQRLPAHTHQRGKTASVARGRGHRGPGEDRRRDHQRGPDPRRDVLHTAGHRADKPVSGRLHRGTRTARGHVPDPDLPRALDRAPSTIKGAMSENALRAAVVGAGPSGFYATDQLLKAGFEVDLLEILPTPFGLVRAGVAPDHPKIKSVTRVYEKTAQHPGFRFYGSVELGGHVSRQDLLDRYHVVLYAVGTASDNKLGIPGEDRPGSHGALEFVAWYNGHPDYADHEFDLSRDARGGHRQRQRRGRRRAHARARPRRDGAHRHRRSRDRAARVRLRARGDRARPPRPGAGRVHDARAARARRADPRRHHRRPGGHGPRRLQRRRGWRKRATRRTSATSS